jgi:hypothetical protein
MSACTGVINNPSRPTSPLAHVVTPDYYARKPDELRDVRGAGVRSVACPLKIKLVVVGPVGVCGNQGALTPASKVRWLLML